MATGYRYAEDADGNVFIIKLNAPHEKLYNSRMETYCSTNCICESIRNADTGEEVEQATLRGVKKVFLTYTKGELIPGDLCWYFHSVDKIYQYYVTKYEEGTKTYAKGADLYKKLDDYILVTCELTFDEVAAELQVSKEDLIDKLYHLKVDKWLSHEQREQAGKPILDAVDAIRRRKIENGEMIPGWKRYLMKMGIKP